MTILAPALWLARIVVCWLILGAVPDVRGEWVYEVTSPYHHIRVRDEQGMRTLMFDNATESRMSLSDPLKGHFEYTEYFHMPWLWNQTITNVLMIGLGGGSTALAWQHYYTNVVFETVELDPRVVEVAQKYFQLKATPKMVIHNEDGRRFLRRSRKQYDLIILDAYTTGRYGSSIPYSLVTKEFFTLAADRLATNGVVAYNVIGSPRGGRENIVGAIYRTLATVFPRVHYFPADSSQNVVFVASKSARVVTIPLMNQRWAALKAAGWTTLPTFEQRMRNYQINPPPVASRSRVLTDDFAPTDGMLSTGE